PAANDLGLAPGVHPSSESATATSTPNVGVTCAPGRGGGVGGCSAAIPRASPLDACTEHADTPKANAATPSVRRRVDVRTVERIAAPFCSGRAAVLRERVASAHSAARVRLVHVDG